jgi:hypothetical protein
MPCNHSAEVLEEKTTFNTPEKVIFSGLLTKMAVNKYPDEYSCQKNYCMMF